MKYAEIKEGMTQGEWEIDNLAIRDSIYPQFCIATVNNNLENWEINQEAITTAIKNTYGKGINPEAVPKLVDAIFFYMGATHPDVRQRALAQVQQAFAMAKGKE